jgi:hypothetical protein
MGKTTDQEEKKARTQPRLLLQALSKRCPKVGGWKV